MNFILIGEKAKISLVLAFLYELVEKEEKIEVFDTNHEDINFIVNYKHDNNKLNLIFCKKEEIKFFEKIKIIGILNIPN